MAKVTTNDCLVFIISIILIFMCIVQFVVYLLFLVYLPTDTTDANWLLADSGAIT